MGNTACTCSHGRHQSEPDKYYDSDIRVEVIRHPKSTTPYDNGPISSLIIEEKFPFGLRNSESDEIFETKASIEQSQIQNDNPYTAVSFRSNLTSQSDARRTTSLFSSEDIEENDNFLNNIHAEIYDIILRDFFMKYYPISDSVITEMIVRNLLLPHDAQLILSQKSNQEKSQAFLDNFVFSEVNICKLATFLHVLETENSQALSEFKKTNQYFRAIVDHIYHIVNLISLLAEYSNDENKLTCGKYLSSMINVNCKQSVKLLKKTPVGVSENVFYIKTVINSISFPSRFWQNFASINDHFRCCQELTLSSCDLRPEDIYNLSLGFVNAGILRHLDVSTNPIADEGLKYLENVFTVRNSIVSLNISCCSITASGMENFLEIISKAKPKHNLKHLNISHNDLRTMSERHVLILTKIPLTSLEIKSINLRQQKSMFESLKLNYSLKRVDFSGNRFLSNDITFLAAGFAYNSCLKTISLAMTGVSEADCFLLNNTFLMNKSLVSIDLSDNLIGDGGADILKDILTMKKTLKYLYLKRCGISLHGTLVLLRKVAEAECKIKLIDLCYNHSPRTSLVVDVSDTIRKIQDLIHHITLVKDIRILLWGTLDELPSNHSECLEH